MTKSTFATFLIILFTNWTYDHHLLWSSDRPSELVLNAAESHYSFLAASPPILPRLLHCIIGVGLIGFFTKLYKASESNYLFDGASLVLYMIGVIMYGTNVIRGLRAIEGRVYNDDAWDTIEGEGTLLGREDTLKVMAATSTILALVYVGVLVLQAGQWYAERRESEEIER
ncbi:Shr3 amino acid permease chaperone [Ascodesmis nigricans]|uniref:Shr3 amino acid permease chaperone n=1 Tax=Ascodesmis nigricans TaxID=341454 RepID=A0A4S2N303_9PEZI|nr:Shr3 amino acid permease chaperone [Ascodesmis nigricans]